MTEKLYSWTNYSTGYNIICSDLRLDPDDIVDRLNSYHEACEAAASFIGSIDENDLLISAIELNAYDKLQAALSKVGDDSK